MTLPEIDKELAEIADAMKPLMQRNALLEAERTRLKSLEWIKANGVTRDRVQLSEEPGIRYFGDIGSFSYWLRATKSTKRFCEWNGRIHLTAEIVAGRFERDAPGRIEDVTR